MSRTTAYQIVSVLYSIALVFASIVWGIYLLSQGKIEEALILMILGRLLDHMPTLRR